MEWYKLFLFLMTGLLVIAVVSAAPSGPTTVSTLGSSRYSTAAAGNVSAIAGNVTEINFAANSITQTWQGYFGNITGTIVLGNSNNQSLYNWNLASPSGEIYATRSSTTPTWTNIRCANLTETNAEDTTLGVNQTADQDSVNRTFLNTTSFNVFYVGSTIINTSQNCRAVNLFNGTGASSSSFQEVLLSDASGSTLVYTSLLANDANGFDNRTHDFEMIVGENGHSGDTTATPYYFYLELQ